MDFKIHILACNEPKLSIEELLLLLDELNLWAHYKISPHSYVRFFYLCLIYEYISDQQMSHAAEAMMELVPILLRKIEEETSQIESQQLLFILLHMHLIYKNIKKYYGITTQIPKEQHIYTLLYEL